MNNIIKYLLSIFLLAFCANLYSYNILLIKDDNSNTPIIIYNDIVSFGYAVDSVSSQFISPVTLSNYDVVVLSSGSNLNSCSNRDMRVKLLDFAYAGGKIIIEGGEVGYNVTLQPGYTAFRTKVTRIINWTSNNGGDLNLSPQFSSSPLANIPNILPGTFSINFQQNFDQDVCSKDEYSDLFYYSSNYPDKIGILVYPAVLNPQIINFSFNYTAVSSHQIAKDILENCLFHLLGKVISVKRIDDLIPSGFKLYQNYPNPFNINSKIKFDIMSNVKGETSNVKLNVFDASGREVAELVNQELKPGSYEVIWDASRITSGIYFYRLVAMDSFGKADLYMESKKTVLIK